MGKTAFLFSGQGAQYPGMMKDLFESTESCRRVFQIADEVLNRSISDLCFYGSQEELNLTHNTQPCMLAADLGAYFAIREKGIEPDVTAGFSVGEFAALASAGVMKIRDAFSLIQLRADFMQEAVPVGKGAMAVIGGMDAVSVKKLCNLMDGYIEPSNFNCPGQIVVSGDYETVSQLVSYLEAQKKKVIMLPVSAPFHCKLMEPAAERLMEPLENMVFENPVYPIYMNVDSAPVIAEEGLKEKIAAQAKSPVHWEQILKNMYADGVDTFIEIGPGKTISGFVKKTFKGIKNVHILRVSDLETLEKMVIALEGKER